MKIQAITVQHDAQQDRIALVSRHADAQQVLLLTRRLAFSLLTALGKIITQSQGIHRLQQSPLQDEWLSMKHAQALSQVRQLQAGQAKSMAPAQRLPSRLLTQIDLETRSDSHTLRFSDTAGFIAELSLDARQLHWFVGRLATHCQAAGWGQAVPVPDWLSAPPEKSINTPQWVH